MSEVKTVQLEKQEAPRKPAEIISALESLKATRGWGLIEKIFTENIQYVERAILDKKDPDTKMELSDEEIEVLRIKRSLNIDVLNTIDNYIKAVTINNIEPKNYDPYYDTMDEINEIEKELRE